jgi:hypothetical protein
METTSEGFLCVQATVIYKHIVAVIATSGGDGINNTGGGGGGSFNLSCRRRTLNFHFNFNFRVRLGKEDAGVGYAIANCYKNINRYRN